MALHEEDREDLLAEAAALSPRAELRWPGGDVPVVVGFRPALGGWSFYFSPNAVYHFDADGRLRRAYVEGALLRSQGTTAARLTRERTPTETILRRHDLSTAELDVLLAELRRRLECLLRACELGELEVLRSVGGPEGFLRRLPVVIQQILAADPPLSPPLRK